MKKNYATIVLCVLVLIACVSMPFVRTTVSGPTLVNTIERVNKSVVRIECPGKWAGSGVIIGDDLILTAGHVITGATDLTIYDYAGKKYHAVVFSISKNYDCGVLLAMADFNDVAVLGCSSKLRPGEQVFIIGTPFDRELFNTVTVGVISGVNRNITDLGGGLISTDCAVYPGNSGGPVFNEGGEVVAIVVAGVGATLNFAVPIDVIKEFIEIVGFVGYVGGN